MGGAAAVVESPQPGLLFGILAPLNVKPISEGRSCCGEDFFAFSVLVSPHCHQLNSLHIVLHAKETTGGCFLGVFQWTVSTIACTIEIVIQPKALLLK